MNVELLIGYANYRGQQHVFIINNYEIKLIPSDPQVLQAYKETVIFNAMTQKKKNKGFIGTFIIEGVCLDGRNIIVSVQDFPWINEGAFSYKVEWIYVYNNGLKKENIKGMSFLSQEINYIYDPKKFIKDDFDFSNGGVDKYTLNINTKNRELLGNFKYEKTSIKIYGNMGWRKNYDTSNNLEIWSILSLEFKNGIKKVEELYDIVRLQKCVIDVLTYRTNNGFDSIGIYTYNKNKKIEIVGNFYVCDKYIKEEDNKKVKQLISCNNINNIGKLYELINENKIYLSHICGSYKLTKTYNPPRMLGIMIAFERIINWKYDKNSIRNDDYLELLHRIDELIKINRDRLCNNLSKSKIRFVNTVKLAVKPKNSFPSYITKVINDYPITISVISTIYGEEVTRKLKTKISKRINDLRNDMAHGNMDIEFNENNKKDLKFMEILFYVIVLSELELPNDEIINKIAILFDIRPFMIIKN